MAADKSDRDPQEIHAIPKVVVARMSLYLRELQRLVFLGEQTVSSTRLGSLLGITDAQVRKDFAFFGQFGYPGIGYKCQELIDRLRRILGTDKIWPVALVGCGNLGQALLGYGGFGSQGFDIVAAFDLSPQLIGREIHGREILNFADFEKTARKMGIKLGILAVPESVAQKTAEQMAAAGVVGILNFAPVTISLPKQVTVAAVDLAIQLEQLTYGVVRQDEVE